MKIAVTGASGYLGRNLIAMYNDACEFIALSRNVSSADCIEGVSYNECDYSIESLKESICDCDAIVHLAYAMATKENEQAGMEAYRSSMDATRNVLTAAAELGIKNIVFASSRLVYPNYSDEPFKEDSQLKPSTSYGKSKVEMERLCEEYNSGHDMNIKSLRFGQIIGKDMKVRGMFQIFIEKARSDEPLTLIGNDIRDYINVKDACSAIMSALDAPDISGIFNISMGTGINNRMMAEAIIKETVSRSEIIVNPEKTTNGDRIVLDCSEAREKLGFTCKYDTIDKIVADTIQRIND